MAQVVSHNEKGSPDRPGEVPTFHPPALVHDKHVHIVVVPEREIQHGGRCNCKCCVSCAKCLFAPCQQGFSLRSFLANYFTYFNVHFIYFVCIASLGAGIIYGIERYSGNHVSFVNTLFMAVSSCCITGLSTVDTSSLQVGSQITMLILMILGSNILMSVVPVLLRIRYYQIKAATQYDDEDVENRILESQVEYRALRWVAGLALTFFAIVHLIPIIALGTYLHVSRPPTGVEDYNPFWTATFLTVASFNNAGFTLARDNLVPVQANYPILIIVSILVQMGNVGYPIVFRTLVATAAKFRPKDKGLKLLLDRPRKCYTHMFSALNTRILLAVLALLTSFQFVLFMALEYNSTQLEALPGATRGLIAYFQSVSTRTAGFNVVDIAAISPGLQVVIALMMYVAAYPFLLSVRRSSEPSDKFVSRVATDDDAIAAAQGSIGSFGMGSSWGRMTDSLGRMNSIPRLRHVTTTNVSASSTPQRKNVTATTPRSARGLHATGESFRMEALHLQPPSNVKDLARGVASKDVLWLFIALVVICISDGARFESDPHPRHFSVFGMLFELSSAYGTVGLSFGYPGTATSLSAQVNVLSKLVIIVVMLCGRHRGLPASVDSAVYLPAILNREPATDVYPGSFNEAMGTLALNMVRRPQKTVASLRNIFPPRTPFRPPAEKRAEELVLDHNRVTLDGDVGIIPDAGFLREIGSPEVTGRSVSRARENTKESDCVRLELPASKREDNNPDAPAREPPAAEDAAQVPTSPPTASSDAPAAPEVPQTASEVSEQRVATPCEQPQ